MIKDRLRNINIQKYAMFIALIAITLFFQFATGGILLKPMNISKLVMQNAYVLILAIGMLPVILTGNVDLSVGSILAFVTAILGTLMISHDYPTWLAIAIGLLVGLLVGAWHGFWIAYVEIPSFIVTLAGMLIFRGLALVILQGNTLAPFPPGYSTMSAGYFPGTLDAAMPVALGVGGVLSVLAVLYALSNRRKEKAYGSEVKKINHFILQNAVAVMLIMLSFYWLGLYQGVPNVLFLLILLVVIYHFVTTNTVLGRNIYAFGGNPKAARLSGINTKRVFFLTYVNMGLLSAVAAIVFSGRLNAATPSAGTGFELDAIAAAYIGGASASGGVGTIVGAVVGGLVMGVLNNGMSIMGIGIDWQRAIKGLVLLGAVAFDTYNKKKKG